MSIPKNYHITFSYLRFCFHKILIIVLNPDTPTATATFKYHHPLNISEVIPMATPRRTIKVPVEIVGAIDKFIVKSKGFFRSRPEVTIEALRKFLKIGKRRRTRKKNG